ncbi:hypothetical protein A3D88_04370 [Candidatus Peribacteria bacterium RIFCSPHIGHO2_02_FULL_52_16]|nr:MAG: hypothetical protein A2706_03000 [Candidatus Peribacteria bacterium RIFCSPHIGHO2_01_FULL_51_35]OGJ60844.1 MAG: hypothetical protein A3D88_04370 [Candidatus Peribacteria bacterium RIFCSPHIGHO2_02_FULL_52_16]
MSDDALTTTAERTKRDKAALVEQLRKTPVIQIACEKTGVSRMTYYRWREDDEFATAADNALADGKSLVNDLAESQLLSALREGEAWSVQYWLRHHHLDYSNKLEITAKAASDKLTPEQQEQLDRALALAGVLPVITPEEPGTNLVPPPPSDNGTSQ